MKTWALFLFLAACGTEQDPYGSHTLDLAPTLDGCQIGHDRDTISLLRTADPSKHLVVQDAAGRAFQVVREFSAPWGVEAERTNDERSSWPPFVEVRRYTLELNEGRISGRLTMVVRDVCTSQFEVEER